MADSKSFLSDIMANVVTFFGEIAVVNAATAGTQAVTVNLAEVNNKIRDAHRLIGQGRMDEAGAMLKSLETGMPKDKVSGMADLSFLLFKKRINDREYISTLASLAKLPRHHYKEFKKFIESEPDKTRRFGLWLSYAKADDAGREAFMQLNHLKKDSIYEVLNGWAKSAHEGLQKSYGRAALKRPGRVLPAELPAPADPDDPPHEINYLKEAGVDIKNIFLNLIVDLRVKYVLRLYIKSVITFLICLIVGVGISSISYYFYPKIRPQDNWGIVIGQGIAFLGGLGSFLAFMVGYSLMAIYLEVAQQVNRAFSGIIKIFSEILPGEAWQFPEIFNKDLKVGFLKIFMGIAAIITFMGLYTQIIPVYTNPAGFFAILIIVSFLVTFSISSKDADINFFIYIGDRVVPVCLVIAAFITIGFFVPGPAKAMRENFWDSQVAWGQYFESEGKAAKSIANYKQTRIDALTAELEATIATPVDNENFTTAKKDEAVRRILKDMTAVRSFDWIPAGDSAISKLLNGIILYLPYIIIAGLLLAAFSSFKPKIPGNYWTFIKIGIGIGLIYFFLSGSRDLLASIPGFGSDSTGGSMVGKLYDSGKAALGVVDKVVASLPSLPPFPKYGDPSASSSTSSTNSTPSGLKQEDPEIRKAGESYAVVTVPAHMTWVKTTVFKPKGKDGAVQWTSKTWRFGPLQGDTVDAAGGPVVAGTTVSGAPMGALIAKVGDNGTPILIGRKGNLPKDLEGEILLGMNRLPNTEKDAGGAIVVQIDIK